MALPTPRAHLLVVKLVPLELWVAHRDVIREVTFKLASLVMEEDVARMCPLTLAHAKGGSSKQVIIVAAIRPSHAA
jgi:hypothetical protein